MLNKFFKRINNRYSKFLRFIFFLRHLFAIFFIFIILLLSLPSFIDYEKKSNFIKTYLIKNYNLDIKNYEKINFQPFPIPSLEIKNASINFGLRSKNLDVKILKIYPKIFSIYNLENLQVKNIFFKDNEVILEFSDLNFFIKKLLSQKNRLSFENLNLNITEKNKSLATLKNIKFSNFGYNKNLITGRIFGKKFKVEMNNDKKNINFKLINSGINADLSFNTNHQKAKSISGTLKSKILNTNIKFNFDYNNEAFKIYNLYYRSKNLSFNSDSLIILEPFLDIQSKFYLEEFNYNNFKKIDLNYLLNSKNIIKKINSENQIFFKTKKFDRSIIDDLNLKINLAYGRINYSKKFLISENVFYCNGNINLLDEFPLLFFDCTISSSNKKELLKQFLIKKTKDDEGVFKLNVKGNLNILNEKINFREILFNNDYKSSKEDLKYFKETFENILYDRGILEIFNLKKIKKFILEIS